MNFYRNSPEDVGNSSGYSGDGDSTTRFRPQNNFIESTNTDSRFRKSISYSENTEDYPTGFRPQNQNVPQQQTTSSRMMRSFGYYDYNGNNQTIPQFSVQRGQLSGDTSSNQTHRNVG